jgi:hypothetical protein
MSLLPNQTNINSSMPIFLGNGVSKSATETHNYGQVVPGVGTLIDTFNPALLKDTSLVILSIGAAITFANNPTGLIALGIGVTSSNNFVSRFIAQNIVYVNTTSTLTNIAVTLVGVYSKSEGSLVLYVSNQTNQNIATIDTSTFSYQVLDASNLTNINSVANIYS